MKQISLFSLFVASLLLHSCQNQPNNGNNPAVNPSTTSPSVADVLPEKLDLKWRFDNKMDKDDVNPIGTVFLVVNGKEIQLVKEETIHYQDLPKSEWGRADVKIPADALIACAGFWAGYDSKYYISRKDNKLVVFEGGVSEDPTVPLTYTAKREISPAELK